MTPESQDLGLTSYPKDGSIMTVYIHTHSFQEADEDPKALNHQILKPLHLQTKNKNKENHKF